MRTQIKGITMFQAPSLGLTGRLTSCVATLCALVVTSAPDTPCSAGLLLWSEAGDSTIKQSNLDGTDIRTVISDSARSLAVDETNNKIYWVNADNGSIKRANSNGTAIETFYAGGDFIRELAVDPTAGYVYWADQGHGTASNLSIGSVTRANLDGTGVTSLLTNLNDPFGIALDTNNGEMFITLGTTPGGSDKIIKSLLDGSSVTDVFLSSGDGLHGIAIDSTNSKIYWPTVFPGPTATLRSANFDGSSVSTLTSGGSGNDWRHVDVNEATSEIYFTKGIVGGGDGIFSINTDGTGLQSIVSTGIPSSLAVANFSSVPEPNSLAIFAIGSIAMLWSRRRR